MSGVLLRKRTISAVCVHFAAVCTTTWAAPPAPATPEEIKALVATTGDGKKYNNADLVYVLDEADVHVAKSGLATTVACQVYKILSDAGVRDRSVLRWDFDPDTYRVTVQAVRIHRAGGAIEDVDLSRLVTEPSVQHLIYWGGRQHLLSLPRLEIGDAVEVRTSRTGFNIAYLSDSAGASGGGMEGELIPPMPGHWYEVTLFQGTHPILRKRYTVHLPRDMPVQYEVYNGPLKSSLWFGEDSLVYTWTAEDVPAVKSEPLMVALDDCVPKLVLATLGSWEEKSRWFHGVNEPQFEADDAIRAKVVEITAGLTDDEEKIAAVTHWVADNIRYYGTKQGGACEGYTLHDSRLTFRDRGGVCKDKAGLLVTMLRVLGHHAFPALTMAGSRVEAIPADQFNHTVTTMRGADGRFRIFDPTWVPLSRELWSAFEPLQGLVYGTPEGQSLTLSPYFDPESNRREVKADSEIGADGLLTSRIGFDLHGAACNRFRRFLHGKPMAERRATFEQALNLAPNAKLESFDYSDPYDYSRNSTVQLKTSVEGWASGGDGVFMFRLPLMTHPLNGFFRAAYLDRLKSKERKYALRFSATRMVRYEETIRLPNGWRIEQVPPPQDMNLPSASLRFSARPGEGTLTYRFEFALKKSIVPPEEYEGYKKSVDAMYDIANAWVVCSTGDREPESPPIERERLVSGTGGGN